MLNLPSIGVPCHKTLQNAAPQNTKGRRRRCGASSMMHAHRLRRRLSRLLARRLTQYQWASEQNPNLLV